MMNRARKGSGSCAVSCNVHHGDCSGSFANNIAAVRIAVVVEVLPIAVVVEVLPIAVVESRA